jgi:phosphoribosylamine-glycine ligase
VVVLAARLEGSKAWSKLVMEAGAIPTARARTFTEVGPAVAFVRELGGHAVVKADGLAAGKGVTVAMESSVAEQAIGDCLEGGAFGEAGETVVVEELLEGPALGQRTTPHQRRLGLTHCLHCHPHSLLSPSHQHPPCCTSQPIHTRHHGLR